MTEKAKKSFIKTYILNIFRIWFIIEKTDKNKIVKISVAKIYLNESFKI